MFNTYTILKSDELADNHESGTPQAFLARWWFCANCNSRSRSEVTLQESLCDLNKRHDNADTGLNTQLCRREKDIANRVLYWLTLIYLNTNAWAIHTQKIYHLC